jgi:hypothetical protein
MDMDKVIKTTIYLTKENDKLLKKIIYLDDKNRKRQALINESIEIGLKKIEEQIKLDKD